MAYVIEKLEQQLVDAISKPEAWVERDSRYAGFFESNRELQNQHIEQGVTIHTPEWKHVASYMSPLEDVQKILKGGSIIRDKKAFYEWLDRNPQYCVYDRRRGRRA